MKRRHLEYLTDWKDRSNRKPLIIRGARQVGKTYLVRDFAERHFDNMVELNLELNPEKADLFTSRDVDEILQLLELDLGVSVKPGRTLLFIDEIQRAPELINFLRYFHEKKPELHVIAAGSLLEFALSDHDFTMPVGRVEYLFLGPLDFSEFLEALGERRFVDFLKSYEFDNRIPASIHQALLNSLKRYFIIGGMPAAVREFANGEKYKLAHMEQQSILQTYQDDFAKYRDKLNIRRLQLVYGRIPKLVGKKMKYVNIDRGERAKDLADCIEMLQMARVLYCVKHAAGNGIPLETETDRKSFKPLFLDVGLLSAALGLNPVDIKLADDLLPLFNGVIAEQFAGQQLLYRGAEYENPELHYWRREKRGAAAEVDYLIAYGNKVVPIEIKSGKTGTLKSLHVFVSEKGSKVAVRFNSDLPSNISLLPSVNVETRVPFNLISLPLYLIGEVGRLIDQSS
ncbi:MAG: AAA family ATPase [Verrucomicrobia bacterium]|nr:AAA family ATPase [Verrucomicrobiota bacterium]